MTVLVIGSTGQTGRPLTRMLRERGAEVKAASRNPEAGGARFDWNDQSTHRAVEGVDSVFLIPPLGTLDPMPLVEPFLEQASSAGVRKVVLLSSSAELSYAPGLAELRTSVRRFPDWAVLRPSTFMQNFTGSHQLAVGIRERGEIVTAAGDGRHGWIDAEDIAAVAAAVLLDPQPHHGEYFLTGPEAFNAREAAAMLEAHTGRPILLVDVSVDALVQRHVETGIPKPFASALATMETLIRDGAEDRVTSTVRDLTGREPRGFPDFLSRVGF